MHRTGIILLLAILLQACGHKGPLYLPILPKGLHAHEEISTVSLSDSKK